MIFTQEMIEEIRGRLSLSGTKDTQIDRLDLLENPLTGKETFVIVRDGENKRISIEELYEDILQYIAGGPVIANMTINPALINIGVPQDVDIKVSVDRIADKITIIKDSQIIGEDTNVTELSITDSGVTPTSTEDINYKAVITVGGRIKTLNATIYVVQGITIKRFDISPSIIYTGQTSDVSIQLLASSDATIEIYKRIGELGNKELIYGPRWEKSVDYTDLLANPSKGVVTYIAEITKNGITINSEKTLSVEDEDVYITSFNAVSTAPVNYTNTNVPVNLQVQTTRPAIITIKNNDGNTIYTSTEPEQSVDITRNINTQEAGDYRFTLTATNGDKSATEESSISIVDMPVSINAFTVNRNQLIYDSGDYELLFNASVSPACTIELYENNVKKKTIQNVSSLTNLSYTPSNTSLGTLKYKLKAINGTEFSWSNEITVSVVEESVVISNFASDVSQIMSGLTTRVTLSATLSKDATVSLYRKAGQSGTESLVESWSSGTSVSKLLAIKTEETDTTSVYYKLKATRGTAVSETDFIEIKKVKPTISMTGTASIYSEELNTVNITATASNTSGKKATIIGINLDNTAVATASNTNSVNYNSNSVQSGTPLVYIAYATFEGVGDNLTITANKTVNVLDRNYAYVGAGETAQDVVINANRTIDYGAGRTVTYDNIVVSYDSPSDPDKYIWFIFPTSMTIKAITSDGGFEVPITALQVMTINNKQYNVYRTQAGINEGTNFMDVTFN